jgi:hypothetical protein
LAASFDAFPDEVDNGGDPDWTGVANPTLETLNKIGKPFALTVTYQVPRD